MTDQSKRTPRDFWIEFGGDPSDDKEVYKRYSAAVPFKPSGFSDEVIHVREVLSETNNITGEPTFTLSEILPLVEALTETNKEEAKNQTHGNGD